MSTTGTHANMGLINARERQWARFLISLTEEEREILYRGYGELIAHDEFVAGNVSLADIRLMLTVEVTE